MASENLFLRRQFEGDFEKPNRLYALLDQVADDRLLFDAVSADFFDQRGNADRGIRAWLRDADRAPIYVLELKDFEAESFARDFFGRRPRWRALDETTAPAWFEFDMRGDAHTATLYPNLYDAGRHIQVASARDLSQSEVSRLEAAFSLDDYEATPGALKAALANLSKTVAWIGVYDVGQGGANGLCDAGESPLAYFDLGGGVLANTTTFPSSSLKEVCYVHAPPVILSHWDWDHWSSGNTFPAAQNLKWVVPNQSLGAVHTTFASGLASAGNLLVWPSGLPFVQVGAVTVWKCQHAGRNHSGLAIEVQGPQGEDPILLTGDARYSAVPGALARTYTSLVVPHHGANMRNHSVPGRKVARSALGAARTAYSYGHGNTFSHPQSITEADHHKNGWPHASQGGAPNCDRQTANRGPVGLGHIGLTWTAGAVLPGHACGQAGCCVGLTQT